jgi:hypothetical protein
MKLTCPNDKTPELPMKMYDPTTQELDQRVSRHALHAGGKRLTAATIAVNIKPSAKSGSSHWVAD